MTIETAAQEMIEAHARVFEGFRAQAEALQAMGQKIAETLARQGCVLACGNGGSASQADHFIGELIGRFRTERFPLPGVALCNSVSSITAIGNDYSFDDIFSRGVEGLGKEGDILFALSTSGNSPNVIKAIDAAKDKGLFAIGLAGKDGGALARKCDMSLVVSDQSTARIQEMHILAIHIICEIIDRAFDTSSA
jgi:D-sedoheptulose 7-phosphate isomerase